LQIAKKKIAELEASGKVKSSIVTQIEDASKHVWYPGEDYHQCYVKNNPTQGYVAGVSIPKLEKVRRTFPQLMKKDA
jgi:peptide methionine sulfoxide reductase MsrA